MSKLLLVEDDETIVENLCVFLQQEGFFVESVFGQKQAIELLEEKNYDLVLQMAMVLQSVPTLNRIQIYR